MRFVILMAALATSSMAATLAVKGPLTEKSAYNMHERFVQNSGAKLDKNSYKNYTVTLGSISKIDDKDAAYMEDIMRKWLAANGQHIRGTKFNVGKCEVANNKVMINGDYVYNEFYSLRDSLTKAIESATPPSGKKYNLATNCNGVFVPSVHVGDIHGFTPKEVAMRVNRRIEQSHIIHNDPYFEVDVDSLAIYR